MIKDIDLSKILVDEYTSPCPISVSPDTPLAEVFDIMEQNGIRHVPVVENDKPIGIIGHRDVQVLQNLETAQNYEAKKVMIENPFSVHTGTSLENVALDLSSKKIGSAIVVDDNNDISGIFTSTDALNALVEIIRGEVELQ